MTTIPSPQAPSAVVQFVLSKAGVHKVSQWARELVDALEGDRRHREQYQLGQACSHSTCTALYDRKDGGQGSLWEEQLRSKAHRL